MVKGDLAGHGDATLVRAQIERCGRKAEFRGEATKPRPGDGMEATLPIGLVGAGGVPVHRKSPEMRRPGATATSSGGRALWERVRGDKRGPAGRGHSAPRE